jgi:hypothetical protein
MAEDYLNLSQEDRLEALGVAVYVSRVAGGPLHTLSA